MNTETIYNVLLDQPRQIDGLTWHGLSYQLTRDEAGKKRLGKAGAAVHSMMERLRAALAKS
jgi:hypothetical protein